MRRHELRQLYLYEDVEGNMHESLAFSFLKS